MSSLKYRKYSNTQNEEEKDGLSQYDFSETSQDDELSVQKTRGATTLDLLEGEEGSSIYHVPSFLLKTYQIVDVSELPWRHP